MTGVQTCALPISATIYQRATSERPEWLIELLTELDDRGTLGQLRSGQVHQLVIDRVTSDDLELSGLAPASGRRLERAVRTV